MRGQIINRGERTWLLRVSKGRDPKSGKRRTYNETFHGIKKQAASRLTDILNQRDKGTFVEPSQITLNEYLDRWLNDAAKQRVGPHTFADYTNVLRRYVRPVLGNRRLHQITPLDIQAVYTEMGARGLTPRTIRYAHTTLKLALKQAVKWRMLHHNPALDVDLPRRVKKEMQAFTPEQAGRFLEAGRADRYNVLFNLALTTGMRPGEYFALRWPDVDFEKQTVTVRRTLVQGFTGSGRSFAEPKTQGSKRTIPLPATVVRQLIEHRRQQAAERLAAGPNYASHDLVFATPTGEPLDLRNVVQRHFKPVLKAAGLPKSFRLYDLRHSCATLLLAQGEHPKVVSERLGHASITLTLDTYSHVLPTMQQQAAERLESVLFSGKK